MSLPKLSSLGRKNLHLDFVACPAAGFQAVPGLDPARGLVRFRDVAGFDTASPHDRKIVGDSIQAPVNRMPHRVYRSGCLIQTDVRLAWQPGICVELSKTRGASRDLKRLFQKNYLPEH